VFTIELFNSLSAYCLFSCFCAPSVAAAVNLRMTGGAVDDISWFLLFRSLRMVIAGRFFVVLSYYLRAFWSDLLSIVARESISLDFPAIRIGVLYYILPQ
jgi:hypothetical protein